MRRIVATLLVVASPALMAVPADAEEARAPAPVVAPAPAVVAPATGVAAPALSETVTPPVASEQAVSAPAVPVPARAVAAVKPVVRTVQSKAPAAVADADDAAYTARLMADLCQARPVFCGINPNGRYAGR